MRKPFLEPLLLKSAHLTCTSPLVSFQALSMEQAAAIGQFPPTGPTVVVFCGEFWHNLPRSASKHRECPN